MQHSRPTESTVRRLFALSGNRCAFPDCSTPLIAFDSIVGDVCHIKGAKPGAARYDASQSDEQRNDFQNLILMCKIHHKVIDDHEDEYTVDRLLKIKQDHENRCSSLPVDEASLRRFVSAFADNSAQVSVVSSFGQTGGQTAHSITNNFFHQGHGNHVYQVATHVHTVESVDVNNCERYGTPRIPSWLSDDPKRMGSDWLVDRLLRRSNLRLYYDPNWCNGTWFVIDQDRGDGVVLNVDQAHELMPPSPTTTTTTTPAP